MDAKLKADWIAALRSGEYEQGTYSFEFDKKFCCLGVLCKVAGKPVNLQGLGNWAFVEFESGLPYEQMGKLWRMNDGCASEGIHQHSFSEIADYIETNL